MKLVKPEHESFIQYEAQNQNIERAARNPDSLTDSQESLQRASKPVVGPNVHWAPASEGCKDPSEDKRENG